MLLLSAVLLFSLVSCGSGGEQKSSKTPKGTIKQSNEAISHQQKAVKKEMPKAQEPAKAATGTKSLGVGPITEDIQLGALDQAMATKGESIFKTKCMVCHKLDVKIIGPPLGCVTKKRSIAWIMNMIMAPDKMIKEDPEAKKLLEEYKTPMSNMAVKTDEARAIVEYLRSKC